MSKQKQKILNNNFYIQFIVSGLTLFFTMLLLLHNSIAELNENQNTSYEIKEDISLVNQIESADLIITLKEIKQSETDKVQVTYSKDWSVEDEYIMAKIIMAEAESCNLQCKIKIANVILNRVNNDDFPDNIEEVILQERKGIYQFTPVGQNKWNNIEPNDECYNALRTIFNYDYVDNSQGALYFESCENEDNWHSNNLEFLYEEDGMRFYK